MRTVPIERDLFALSSGGDEWGNVMSHLFGIATAVYAVNGEIWEEFHPSPYVEMAPETLDEWPDAEYGAMLQNGTIDVERLHHFYRVLLRYARLLDYRGESY